VQTGDAMVGWAAVLTVEAIVDWTAVATLNMVVGSIVSAVTAAMVSR